jgi:hypothetical protein
MSTRLHIGGIFSIGHGNLVKYPSKTEHASADINNHDNLSRRSANLAIQTSPWNRRSETRR